MSALTADQKRILHTCPECDHLLGSHDGSGCPVTDDKYRMCRCEQSGSTVETTYAAVRVLLDLNTAALREETTPPTTRNRRNQ